MTKIVSPPHDYPRKGVVQNWRRDRAYGEIKDLQTGQCYRAPISGNRGIRIDGGTALDGITVRFWARTTSHLAEWICEDQFVFASTPPPQVPSPVPTPPPPALAQPPPPPQSVPIVQAHLAVPAIRPAPPPVQARNGTIKEFLQQRGVTDVYHFTRETNLATIMQYGLLSRSELSHRNIPFTFNDTKRLDNAQESTSVSIDFPNYKMFYMLRQSNTKTRWVVLNIAPDILWNFRCAFCKENAASNTVRFQDMQTRMTLQTLEDLFADFPHKKRCTNIPASYPTSPQAEVLVFDPIPVTMIRNVCVRFEQDLLRVQAQVGQVGCVVKPDVFKQRCDWDDWQSQYSMQFM